MSTEASAVAGAKAGPLEAYHEKSALNNGFKGAIQSGAFGLFVSAVQNSLATHKHGAMGIFTRTGSSIGLFAAIGAAYGVTESFVSNLRHKDDSVNSAVGACASGLVIGASGEYFFLNPICVPSHILIQSSFILFFFVVGSIPTMFGSCAGLAAVVGTFGAAGRSLTGPYSAALVDAAKGDNSDNSTTPGEVGWRAERERRRNSFFKVSTMDCNAT